MNKKQLQLKKNKLEDLVKEVDKELKYLEIPEKLRDRFKLMFGWPRIDQELQLQKKLDKETYNKLYSEIKEIIEEVVKEVPEYKDAKETKCSKCESIKNIIN